MSWLDRLQKSTAIAPEATLIDRETISKEGMNAGESAEPLDPDRWCWPHSIAMNSNEIRQFMARVDWFVSHGIGVDQSESTADRLVIRDRECDARRLCVECRYQSQGQCRNRKAPHEFANGDRLTLQRCEGFALCQ